MPERRIRSIVLHSIRGAPERILDIGCGTGTQLLLTRAAVPLSTVVGADIDERILRIAERKCRGAGSRIPLVCASATSLPFADNTFDYIVSTLVLHHLTPEGKRACIGEAFRLLRAGGEFHVTDFGMPSTPLMRLAARISTLLEDRTRMTENVQGKIPEMCQAAGFDVREFGSTATLFGTVRMLACRKQRSSEGSAESLPPPRVLR
jgi:SAM-dependent methyltransferase